MIKFQVKFSTDRYMFGDGEVMHWQTLSKRLKWCKLGTKVEIEKVEDDEKQEM